MRIAIIGKGNVGSSIGRGWRAKGHEVVFGLREPHGADERPVGDAVAAAELVALATPWNALADAVQAGGGFAGKTVIDCTNPLVFEGGRLQLDPALARSGAERLQALAPEAFVFKSLNQTGAENMDGARRFAQAPAMFVAGDHADRKATVLDLVRDLGFEALDAGPLANAGLLEAFAMLWIDQAMLRGRGRDFAFARIAASR